MQSGPADARLPGKLTAQGPGHILTTLPHKTKKPPRPLRKRGPLARLRGKQFAELAGQGLAFEDEKPEQQHARH